ncbi:MAG: hypothetical protein QGG71_17935 [Pirellulaceae bacterium]|jgi:hypothetical protein|nr:hypothetical protein [Planctomycetaceae bacterium]MDP6556556.1 hypothetical protein [Pirellulaceae bacterium]
MFSRGGREGEVYVVTNLNGRGPGSLREAVEADGARIVVFAVGGAIDLGGPLAIRNPYCTIKATLKCITCSTLLATLCSSP